LIDFEAYLICTVLDQFYSILYQLICGGALNSIGFNSIISKKAFLVLLQSFLGKY